MDDRITVNDIHNIQYEMNKENIKLYNEHMRRVYGTIRDAVKKNEVFCIHKIPQMLMGFHIFNIPECANFIIRQLIKDGYKVKFIFPSYLMIIWNYKPKESQVDDIKISKEPLNSVKTYMSPFDDFLFRKTT